jgi:hypothetical protein
MREHRFSLWVESVNATPITDKITGIADALGFTINSNYSSSRLSYQEKLEQLKEYDGVVLVFDQTPAPPTRDSLTIALHACQGLQKPYIIVLGQKDALDFGEIEYINLAELDPDMQYLRLTQYLNSLRDHLQRVYTLGATLYPYEREFVKREIDFQRSGDLLYKTAIRIRCNRDGVSDFHHTFHMRHGLHLPEGSSEDHKIEFVPGNSRDRSFTVEKVLTDSSHFGLRISLDPPLSRGDAVGYGWHSTFRHCIHPGSTASHSVDSRQIEHHFFISQPTRFLELSVCVFDRALVGVCEVSAFSGRTLGQENRDKEETERINRSIRIEDFNEEKRIHLQVQNPRLHFSYTLYWTFLAELGINAGLLSKL